MRVLRFDFNDGEDVQYGVPDGFESPVLHQGWFRFVTVRSDQIGVSAREVRCWLVYEDGRE